MKALCSFLLGLLLVGVAFGQTITAGTTTVDKNGKSFFVFLPLVNSGTATVNNVTVTGVKLGSSLLSTGLKLPFSIGNLGAGAFGSIRMLFPDRTLVAGQNYVVIAQGTFQLNGSPQTFQVSTTVTYGQPTIFDDPANPLAVTPSLDTAHAVTQVISGATGGTLTTTGTDGSVFTLTFPANALASDEQITMTPLATAAGLPASGGLLAGVDLQPDGMRLMQPVALSIQPVANIACDQQIGFGYHGAGQEFYFQPLGLSQTITINLEHFSAAGVGQGQAGNGGIPTAYEDRLSQMLQPILQQQRQCTLQAPQDNSQFLQVLEGNMQLFYDKVVVPGLQAAKTDDSQAETALANAFSFARQATLLGLDSEEPFSLDIKYIFQSFPVILKNAYNKAYGRCLNDTSQTSRMKEGAKMISVARIFELIGDPITKEFPNFTQQLSGCLVGPLTLIEDSTATGVDNEGVGAVVISTQSHVATQSLPMSFNATQLTYTGDGPLAYDSYSVSVVWATGLPDCSTGAGNPGSLNVVAAFDVNAFPTSPDQVRLELALTPSITETTTLAMQTPAGCVGTTVTSNSYEQDIDASHSDKQQTATHFYYVYVNTPITYNLVGTSSYANVVYQGTEETSLTASQTQ